MGGGSQSGAGTGHPRTRTARPAGNWWLQAQPPCLMHKITSAPSQPSRATGAPACAELSSGLVAQRSACRIPSNRRQASELALVAEPLLWRPRGDRAPLPPALQANPFGDSSLYDLNTTYVPPDLIVHEQTPDAVVPAVPIGGAPGAAASGRAAAAAPAAAAPLQFTGRCHRTSPTSCRADGARLGDA